MVSEELISYIKDRFKHGKRRSEIKEELLTAGVDEEDIDTAITKIQHDVIKQLPGISWIYKQIEHLESKHNLATPRMTALLMGCCIVFLLVFAGGLYLIFDPLGAGSAARDVKRQADETVIQNALTAYYQKAQQYPQNLDLLVPTYLTSLPDDPQSGAEYSYQPLANNTDYKLCITFEQQQIQCVSAAPAENAIPLVPTETPVPSFVPRPASSSIHTGQGL